MSRSTVRKPARVEVVAMKSRREVSPADDDSELNALLAKESGKGLSSAPEDNLIPMILILQALSPQVRPRDAAYIKGAQPGMIWLRGSDDPPVDGDDGILFQPCYFDRDWIEWVPRDSGGGLVARHKKCPKEVKQSTDPKNRNKVRFEMPNGNEVVETRHHIGYVVEEDGSRPRPFVISFSSSGHAVSRGWMTLMHNVPTNPDDGSVPPSFAYLYRLKTKERSNVQGTWFVWDITMDRKLKTPEVVRGIGLHNSFSAGEKRLETADNLAEEGTEEDL